MFEVGSEKGKYYSLNVPLKDGIDDHSMLYCDPFIRPSICLSVHPFVIYSSIYSYPCVHLIHPSVHLAKY